MFRSEDSDAFSQSYMQMLCRQLRSRKTTITEKQITTIPNRTPPPKKKTKKTRFWESKNRKNKTMKARKMAYTKSLRKKYHKQRIVCTNKRSEVKNYFRQALIKLSPCPLRFIIIWISVYITSNVTYRLNEKQQKINK